MPYRLKLLPAIERQLRKIPDRDRERVVEAMRSLATEPRRPGTTHLSENLYRIRVGNYRIVYAIFDTEPVVLICKVARRTEATYKDIRALLKRARDALDAA
jgi:mRNA interferase RelE/StbE